MPRTTQTMSGHISPAAAELAARKATCDDCREVWPVADLVEPENLSQRLDPGGPTPAGECPGCGALAYVEPKPEAETLPENPTVEQLATLELPDPAGATFDYQEAVEARFTRIAEVARTEREDDGLSIDGGELGDLSVDPFRKDLEGEYPADTVQLFDLRDGAAFTDRLGRSFRRIGYGPVQGSIEIAEPVGDTRAYWDGDTRVRKVGA